MRFLARFGIIAGTLCASMLAGRAFAAEMPPGVFKMADGSYYQPSTGKVAASLVELGFEASSAAPAPSGGEFITLPVKLFQMADGTFFHPGTGLKSNNESDLRAELAARGIVGETVPADTRPPVLQAVSRAQAELQSAIDADKLAHPAPVIVGNDDIWRDVTLAVWNRQTGAIRFVKGRKKGTALELEPGAAEISVRRSNYINSEYVLDNPDELVVAVRYPILKSIPGAEQYELNDEVYSPYTRDLHMPEVVAEGEKYLDRLITGVFDGMRADGIKSRAYPSQLMADSVDPELVKNLIVIEHTDSALLRQDPKLAVERIQVLLALNRGNTYNYSRSTAGALGLVQFIPKTYNSFASRAYLKLNPDFENGMRDHANAVRAQVAYLDDALASLPVEARAIGWADPKVHEYLAASYNGGYAKVRTAIQIWDEQISGELKPYEILSRSRLRPETIDYVKKLRNARSVMLASDARLN